MAAVDRLRAYHGDNLLVRSADMPSVRSFGSQASAAASAISGAISGIAGNTSRASEAEVAFRPDDNDLVIDPYELGSSEGDSQDSDPDDDSRRESDFEGSTSGGYRTTIDGDGVGDESDWATASGYGSDGEPYEPASPGRMSYKSRAGSVATRRRSGTSVPLGAASPPAAPGALTSPPGRPRSTISSIGGRTARSRAASRGGAGGGAPGPSAAAPPSRGGRSMHRAASVAPSAAVSGATAAAAAAGAGGVQNRLSGKAVRRRLLRQRGWEFKMQEDEIDFQLGRNLPDVLTRPLPTVNSEDEEEEEDGEGDGSESDRAAAPPPPGPALESIKTYAHERAPEVLWSERVRAAKKQARRTGQVVTVRGRLDPKRRRELARKIQKWDNREWFASRKKAPPAPPLHPAVARVIEQWFSLVDDDGSGTLDHSELLAALEASNVPVSPANINEMIELMDMDGDGVINWKEFETFFMYEFAAGKNLLSGEYVLPSGVALPFGAMIAKLKRNKLVTDLVEGGKARARWQDIAEDPLALEDELGMMAAVELAMEEMKNPALGRARARAAKALARLPPHLRTPSLQRHLQRHPEITEKVLRAPSIAPLLMNTMKRMASTSSAVMARLASHSSNASAASRASSVGGMSMSSNMGGGGGGGGKKAKNVDLNVAAALAAGLEWPVNGANFYNRRSKTVLQAMCHRPPETLAKKPAQPPAAAGTAAGGAADAAAGGAAAGGGGAGPSLLREDALAAAAASAAADGEKGGADGKGEGGGKGFAALMRGSRRLGRGRSRNDSDDEEGNRRRARASASGDVLPWLVNAKQREEEERAELRAKLGGGGGGGEDEDEEEDEEEGDVWAMSPMLKNWLMQQEKAQRRMSMQDLPSAEDPAEAVAEAAPPSSMAALAAAAAAATAGLEPEANRANLVRAVLERTQDDALSGIVDARRKSSDQSESLLAEAAEAEAAEADEASPRPEEEEAAAASTPEAAVAAVATPSPWTTAAVASPPPASPPPAPPPAAETSALAVEASPSVLISPEASSYNTHSPGGTVTGTGAAGLEAKPARKPRRRMRFEDEELEAAANPADAGDAGGALTAEPSGAVDVDLSGGGAAVFLGSLGPHTSQYDTGVGMPYTSIAITPSGAAGGAAAGAAALEASMTSPAGTGAGDTAAAAPPSVLWAAAEGDASRSFSPHWAPESLLAVAAEPLHATFSLGGAPGSPPVHSPPGGHMHRRHSSSQGAGLDGTVSPTVGTTPALHSVRPSLVVGGGGGGVLRSSHHLTGEMPSRHGTGGGGAADWGSSWDAGDGGGGWGGAAAAAAEELDVDEARELMSALTLQLTKEDTLYDIHTGHMVDRPSTSDFKAALTRMRTAAAALVHSYSLPLHPGATGAAAPLAAGAAAASAAQLSSNRGRDGGGGSGGGAAPAAVKPARPYSTRASQQVLASRPQGLVLAGSAAAGASSRQPTAAAARSPPSPSQHRPHPPSAQPSVGSSHKSGAVGSDGYRTRGISFSGDGGGGDFGGGGSSVSPSGNGYLSIASDGYPSTSGMLPMAAAAAAGVSSSHPTSPTRLPDGGIVAAAIATARFGSRPGSRCRTPVSYSGGGGGGGSRSGSRGSSPLPPPLPLGQLRGDAAARVSGRAAARSPTASARGAAGATAASPSPPPELWDAHVASLLQAHTAAELATARTSQKGFLRAAGSEAASPVHEGPLSPHRTGAQGGKARPRPALALLSARGRAGGAGGGISHAAAVAAQVAQQLHARSAHGLVVVRATEEERGAQVVAAAAAPDPVDVPGFGSGADLPVDPLLGPPGSDLPEFIPLSGAMPRLQSRYAPKRPPPAAAGEADGGAAASLPPDPLAAPLGAAGEGRYGYGYGGEGSEGQPDGGGYGAYMEDGEGGGPGLLAEMSQGRYMEEYGAEAEDAEGTSAGGEAEAEAEGPDRSTPSFDSRPPSTSHSQGPRQGPRFHPVLPPLDDSPRPSARELPATMTEAQLPPSPSTQPGQLQQQQQLEQQPQPANPPEAPPRPEAGETDLPSAQLQQQNERAERAPGASEEAGATVEEASQPTAMDASAPDAPDAQNEAMAAEAQPQGGGEDLGTPGNLEATAADAAGAAEAGALAAEPSTFTSLTSAPPSVSSSRAVTSFGEPVDRGVAAGSSPRRAEAEQEEAGAEGAGEAGEQQQGAEGYPGSQPDPTTATAEAEAAEALAWAASAKEPALLAVRFLREEKPETPALARLERAGPRPPPLVAAAAAAAAAAQAPPVVGPYSGVSAVGAGGGGAVAGAGGAAAGSFLLPTPSRLRLQVSNLPGPLHLYSHTQAHAQSHALHPHASVAHRGLLPPPQQQQSAAAAPPPPLGPPGPAPAPGILVSPVGAAGALVAGGGGGGGSQAAASGGDLASLVALGRGVGGQNSNNRGRSSDGGGSEAAEADGGRRRPAAAVRARTLQPLPVSSFAHAAAGEPPAPIVTQVYGMSPSPPPHSPRHLRAPPASLQQQPNPPPEPQYPHEAHRRSAKQVSYSGDVGGPSPLLLPPVHGAEAALADATAAGASEPPRQLQRHKSAVSASLPALPLRSHSYNYAPGHHPSQLAEALANIGGGGGRGVGAGGAGLMARLVPPPLRTYSGNTSPVGSGARPSPTLLSPLSRTPRAAWGDEHPGADGAAAAAVPVSAAAKVFAPAAGPVPLVAPVVGSLGEIPDIVTLLTADAGPYLRSGPTRFRKIDY